MRRGGYPEGCDQLEVVLHASRGIFSILEQMHFTTPPHHWRK